MNTLRCAPVRAPRASIDGLHLPREPRDAVVLRLGSRAEDEAFHEMITVFLGSRARLREEALPITGQYDRSSHLLKFTPAFGFEPGQSYVVRIQVGAAPPRFVEFSLPAEVEVVEAQVVDVFPSSAVLPENVLRFYVHFSVPMAPHRAWEFIGLHDDTGSADDAAFMRFKQELWSEDRRRLTLLIDPGRIKRGVGTHLGLGPALQQGRRYALTLGPGWPSADGSSQLQAFCKRFDVGAPLRDRPDARRWSFEFPSPRTRDPLAIVFDRCFDRHRLDDALRVEGSGGRAIEGRGAVGTDEMSWTFTPDEPWDGMPMRVAVDPALEDVAGNNFHELLDTALDAPSGRAPRTDEIRLISSESTPRTVERRGR